MSLIRLLRSEGKANRKRKERRKIKNKKRFFNAIESRKQYIKNLSNEQLTDEQITLLARGLKFIPTPVTRDKRKSYQAPASRGFQSIYETNATTIYFARGRKRTSSFPREVGLGTTSPVICSSGDLPRGGKIRSQVLNLTSQKIIYLRESAKLSKSYRATKAVFLRNLIRVNTTVLMSRQDKLNEGQVLLDDLNNYRPLDKPMIETTTKKAQQLIKTLLSEGHIDKTTAKWLSLTPNPP